MSRFNSDKVMPRYFAIAVVFTFIGFAIVGKAMYIMTAKKDYWTQVASRLKRDSVSVKPTRGNILSCDGQLMAGSIPEYKVFVDFQAGATDSIGNHNRDSLWEANIDSLCYGLNQIFRATGPYGTGASTTTPSARYTNYQSSASRKERAVSIGRPSMRANARSDHWPDVPLATCISPRTVPRTVWSCRTTPSSVAPTV